jgi:hypothetical protein
MSSREVSNLNSERLPDRKRPYTTESLPSPVAFNRELLSGTWGIPGLEQNPQLL